MLRVRLLGGIDLEADGRALPTPDGQPARGLLAWLALNPGVHTRETIAEELWPGGLRKAQRDSLKTALAKVRRVLPDEVVERCFVVSRSQLGILEGHVTTDLTEMHQLIDAGDLTAALALARGDVLPGLRMEWIEDLRATHHLAESGLLAMLAEDAAEAGDRGRALELTRRRVRLDPLDEDAALFFMELLLAEGKDRAALEEHERLRRAHRRAGLAYQPSLAMHQITITLRSRLGAIRRALGTLPGGQPTAEPVAEALHAFRWDAYLRSADDDDPYPDFAIEAVHVSSARRTCRRSCA